MKTSQAGIDLIKSFEGLELTAYRCSSGIWTIGYGHTGPDVKPGMTITQARADELLAQDLVRFEQAVDRLIEPAQQQCQFDALVSFTFNCGEGALSESTMRRRMNAGEDLNTVAREELPKWVKGANGEPLPGLVRRRDAEVALHCSGGSTPAPAPTAREVNVTAKRETVLKKRPVPSSELAENEKATVPVGKAYAKAQVLGAEAGHTRLELPYGGGQWWLFDDHWSGLSAAPAQPSGGEVKLPGFIHWDQKDNASDGWRECQSSSIAMCLKFLGIGNLSTDQQYVSIVEKYGDTTERQPHFDAMKQLGYTGASWHTDLTAERIKAEINKGKPVAVGALHKGHVSNPSGGGHFVVIYGYGPDYWCVMDPYGEQDLVNGDFCNTAIGAGKDQRYSFKNFNPRLFVADPADGWGWTFA
jgi:lysozyme